MEDDAQSEDGRKNRKRVKTFRRHSEKKRKDSQGNFVESSDDISEYNTKLNLPKLIWNREKLTNITVSNKPFTSNFYIKPDVINVVRQSAQKTSYFTTSAIWEYCQGKFRK